MDFSSAAYRFKITGEKATGVPLPSGATRALGASWINESRLGASFFSLDLFLLFLPRQYQVSAFTIVCFINSFRNNCTIDGFFFYNTSLSLSLSFSLSLITRDVIKIWCTVMLDGINRNRDFFYARVFRSVWKKLKNLNLTRRIVSKVGRKESSKRNIQELHMIGV